MLEKESVDTNQSETPTFGMKLVGITFNPSGDAKVNRAKEICAELADLVKAEYETRKFDDSDLSRLDTLLFTHTIGEILNAQMNAVKLITLKY
jgi:hypothetical protein